LDLVFVVVKTKDLDLRFAIDIGEGDKGEGGEGVSG
jgi:hypothetical protein